MKNLAKITALLVISVFIFSCEADKGDIGPRGEIGPKGDSGEKGISNIIYSDWVDTEFKADINSTAAFFRIDAPEITPEILNSGTVLIYGDSGNSIGQSITTLPITLGFSGTFHNFYFTVRNGEISILINSTQNIGNGGAAFSRYRYVIIPQQK